MFGFKKHCRNYDVLDAVAPSYGGSFGLWTIYAAVHKKTQTPASVFVLAKKALEKQLFAKSNNVEMLYAFMRREQQNERVKSLLQHFEPLQEDQSCMVFVTERVLGSLLDVLSRCPREPDMFLLGLATLAQDLAQIEKNGCCGSVAPTNIVVTAQGFWRVVGFGASSLAANKQPVKPEFQFQAPPPAFSGSTQTFGAQRDLSQALCSVFSVLEGTLAPLPSNFDEQAQLDLAAQLGCRNAKFVQTGHGDQRISQLFQGNAFTHDAAALLAPALDEVKTALYNGLLPSDFVQAVEKKLSQCALYQNLAATLSFNEDLPKMPVAQAQKISMLLGQLVQLRAAKQMSRQFFQDVLLWPLTRMLQFEEMHAAAVQALIKLGKDDYAQPVLTFLLFEPIMVACTLARYRSKYPLQPSNAPFAAFQSVQMTDQLAVFYKNPFLQYYDKQHKTDLSVPNFDQILTGTRAHTLLDTCKVLYQNLDFFLQPQTGGRSHFHTINFLASQLASGDSNSELLEILARNVHHFGDKNWCCAENLVMREIHSRFIKQYKVKNDKAVIYVDPFKPLNSFLVPNLQRIMAQSQYQSQIVSSLECLTNCIDYFMDTEISGEVLPALYAAMPNIEKYPKAMIAFSRFAQRCSKRCTGKTVAKLFVSRVFGCMYSQEICSDELRQLREIADDIVAVVFRDVDQKLGNTQEQAAEDAEKTDEGVAENVSEKELSELEQRAPPVYAPLLVFDDGILE